MKPAGISGIKREYLKDKINELAMNSKNKFRVFFKSIDESAALDFTVTSAPLAARRMQILPMDQPLTFGTK
jgi:hypothetical protein